MKTKNKFLLILLLQGCLLFTASLTASAAGYKYLCNSEEIAQKAKQILEEKKFFLDFCSNCDAKKASLRRVEIESVTIQTRECGAELSVKGKLVRGVKPPIFGGECTDKIEVYNPSIPLALEYNKEVDLAYSYVFDAKTKTFKTLAELVGLGAEGICIKQVMFGK